MKKVLLIPAAVLGIAAGKMIHKMVLHSAIKEKRHAAVPAILCIGDSITFGAGVYKSRKTDCWVRQLEKLLQGKYQTLNYGICGATLLKDGDMPYRKYRFIEAAKEQNPETVLLMLGTNDSKPQNWNAEAYRAELKEMVLEIREWDSVQKLYVLVPPFCCPVKPGAPVEFKIRNEVIRDEIRPIIYEEVKENNVYLIDLYTLTEDHPEYFVDGVHPNQLGNQIIAKWIADAIRAENEV